MLQRQFPTFLKLSEPTEIRAFLLRSLADRSAHDAVGGHMPFGLDAYVARQCRYIVWLRNPVDRFISSYFQARAHPENELHRFANEHTLLEYVETAPTFMRENGLTRRMASYDLREALSDGPVWWQTIPIGQTSEAMLEQAKANVARSCIGIYELFDESIRRSCAAAGISASEVPHLNASNREYTIDTKTIDAIRDRHTLDGRLYEYALALFRKS
jgi:Sulfotransferase family